ncbi:hypothetical protein ACFLV4_06305 [Chloroflexota bacterium]
MKRKWSSTIAILFALMVLVSTAVPVLAQSEEQEVAEPHRVPRAGLAIIAPRRAPVGEEVSMTVFQRDTQDPVKDAAIWALTRENAESLKQKIAELREKGNSPIQDLDWESPVGALGIFLGTTKGNGQLRYLSYLCYRLYDTHGKMIKRSLTMIGCCPEK